MQEDNQEEKVVSAQAELSAIWQELLGGSPLGQPSLAPGSPAIPALASDPWSALVQAKGVETVDLQLNHLQLSDQEVEQMLQLMQEQPKQKDENSSSR